MLILLDECLPWELVDELVGHEVRTVQQQGRSGLENGELLRRAAGAFGVFLTVDKQIEGTQQLPANLGVVTIRELDLTASSPCDRWCQRFSKLWKTSGREPL